LKPKPSHPSNPQPSNVPNPSYLSNPRSVFPLVLAGFASFLDLYAAQPLLPLLVDVFDATQLAVSLTITAPTIGVALAAPIVGRIADMVGRKRVIVGSAFLLALTTVLAATSSTLNQLVVWRFVQGLFTPGVFAITIAYAQDEWPVTHAGRATAAYVSGTVVGGFCGRTLVGLVAADFGWQLAFVALSLVNLGVAAALASWLPRETKEPAPQRGHGQSIARLVSNRQLLATDLVGFCVLFTQIAMFSYVMFHLSAPPYGLGTAALGWLFAVYLVGAAVVPFAGHWIDAHGHRAGILSGMAISGAGAVLTLAGPLPLVIVGLALVGSGVFVAQATASSYIGRVTSDDRGLAVGLYSSCYYAGGSLGGALPSLFWTAGGWRACVALVIAVQALTVLVAMTYWHPGHRRSETLGMLQ
jgi:MFS family permease